MIFLITKSLIIGFAAGFVSGHFGIGGGLITKPAIRLFLDQKALIAVGTPLPIIIPTTLAGLYNYRKNNFVNHRAGLIIGLTGAISSIFGAYLTILVSGSIILIIASIIIGLTSLRFLRPRKRKVEKYFDQRPIFFAATGLIAGFLSGFLGLGGGFIIIPTMTRLFGVNIKEAIGTSLLAIAIFVVPSSITHVFLGNVNPKIALFMIFGVIPGAYLGSKLTIAFSPKTVNSLFGLLLLFASAYLAINEILILV